MTDKKDEKQTEKETESYRERRNADGIIERVKFNADTGAEEGEWYECPELGHNQEPTEVTDPEHVKAANKALGTVGVVDHKYGDEHVPYDPDDTPSEVPAEERKRISEANSMNPPEHLPSWDPAFEADVVETSGGDDDGRRDEPGDNPATKLGIPSDPKSKADLATEARQDSTPAKSTAVQTSTGIKNSKS